MLLKLQMYPKETGGWKFYDSVSKLNYTYMELDRVGVEDAIEDMAGLDCFIVGDDRCYTDICFETQCGVEYRVIAGLAVYLCDDHGRTIEVINH